MKFCSNCAAPVVERIPAGDNRPRYVCDACERIHYENPRIIAGCLPTWQGQVLLCKRAIEPRAGYWTLPAGFMENGETVEQAACRETLEEANAEVRITGLQSLISIPHISQVYMLFHAELLDQNFSAGAESLDVALFKPEAIPWDELAFHVMTRSLKYWLSGAQTPDIGCIDARLSKRSRGEQS